MKTSEQKTTLRELAEKFERLERKLKRGILKNYSTENLL